MILDDITVEVVDIDLKRLGQIDLQTLNVKAIRRRWGVGEWTVKLPQEAPLVNDLWTMGAGIIISVRDEVFLSGPVYKPRLDASSDDPDGLLTFTGYDHNILLNDAKAWPLPTQPDVTLQTVAYDVRTGDAETVMKGYVNYNIGPGAPTARRGKLAQKLTMATNLHRGRTVTKSARFYKLLDLLSEIGAYADLDFRIRQIGSQLVFDVIVPNDRTDFISFDIENGTLENQSIEMSAPELTRAIVAGQGEAELRQFLMRTSTDSLQSEQDWGRIIEEFIDQRQTDDLAELQQAGDERLAEAGFTNVAVKAVPADEYTREYGIDWNLNDLVKVVVNGQSRTTRVTEVALIASPDGVAIGAALGDVSGFHDVSRLGGRLYDAAQKLESLERNR